MSDSGHTLEICRIEPREAFRGEEAGNLEDLAERNRKPITMMARWLAVTTTPAAPLTRAGALIAAVCADVIEVRATSAAPRRTNDRAGCPFPPSTTENGGTTMLKRVVYVALLVSDQDKALDFYTNVMGLEKRGDYETPDGPRFLTVGVKGQDFELVLWPGTPGSATLGSAICTIEVEDCRMAFEMLKLRGVKFESPDILEFPWGHVARFKDADGNLLQVREGRGVFRR
jgi:catechol 2,3-dioxygenase-like lactoylglutathione lyase family enzyme